MTSYMTEVDELLTAEVISQLLAQATTAQERNAVARTALRAGLMWHCQSCKTDNHQRDRLCPCGALRPTALA